MIEKTEAVQTEAETVQYIPDATGTVAVKGIETAVDKYLLDAAYLKSLEEALSAQKVELRSQMATVLKLSAPGTKAIYFYGQRGGLRVTPPDAESIGNRPNFSDATRRVLRGVGGIEGLGVAEEEVVEKHVQVTLSGAWAARFLAQLEKMIEAGTIDPEPADIKVEEKTKVKFSALDKLKELAALGNAVAQVLLQRGVKSATIRGEELWR